MIYSKDLEQKVLKGLIQHQEEWYQVCDKLTERDFDGESKVHSTIFKMLRNSLNNGEKIDDTILIERINGLKIGFPDSIDIAEYIRNLYCIPLPKEIFFTAIRELKKFTIRRELLEKEKKTIEFLKKPDPTLSYSQIIEEVDKLHNHTINSFELGDSKIINLGEEAESLIESIANNPPKNTGGMSPYETLNKIYGSLVRGGNCAIIAARAKCGKAQPIDAKVFTDNGPINIGNIKVGDEIFSDDGLLKRVVGVFPQGEKDVFKVTMSDGSFTECCDDHLWRVKFFRGKRKEYYTAPLKEFKGNLYRKNSKNASKPLLNYSIPLASPVQFSKKDLKIHPYVLGILLGDGCFYNKRCLLASADKEIVDRVQSLLPEEDFLKQCESQKYAYRIIKKCGVAAKINEKFDNRRTTTSNYIEMYGLTETRCETKFIPQEYLYSSIEDREALLQGLLDSDGYIQDRNTSQFSFASKSKFLIDGFKFLVESLGGKVRPTRLYNRTGVMSVTGNFNKSTGIKPFFLSRKLERFSPTEDSARRISRVEFVGKKQCVCISIDTPSQLYLTDNFIVTHNTTMLVDMTTKMSYNNKVPIIHFDNGEMSSKELTMRMVSGMSGIPIHLLETGKWRTHGYKDWTAKEVVDRVRSVWDKTKNTKILYENVAGLDAEDMVSLLKRIYYAEIGRGKEAIFSFDYLKTDFNNLGKGSEWAFSGRVLHLFKQCISRQLVFDGEPTVGMLTSVQTNRTGIVDSKKGAEFIVENESVIANADQYIQFASHMFLLRKKIIDELVDEGENFGTHKLICLAARHLGEDAYGHLNPVEMPDGSKKNNFINLEFDNFSVTDKGDLRDIVHYLNHEDVQPKRADEENDLPPDF